MSTNDASERIFKPMPTILWDYLSVSWLASPEPYSGLCPENSSDLRPWFKRRIRTTFRFWTLTTTGELFRCFKPCLLHFWRPHRGTKQAELLQTIVDEQVEWLRKRKPTSFNENPSNTAVHINFYLQESGSTPPRITKNTDEEYYLQSSYDGEPTWSMVWTLEQDSYLFPQAMLTKSWSTSLPTTTLVPDTLWRLCSNRWSLMMFETASLLWLVLASGTTPSFPIEAWAWTRLVTLWLSKWSSDSLMAWLSPRYGYVAVAHFQRLNNQLQLNVLHWHIVDTHSYPVEQLASPIDMMTQYGAYGPDMVYSQVSCQIKRLWFVWLNLSKSRPISVISWPMPMIEVSESFPNLINLLTWVMDGTFLVLRTLLSVWTWSRGTTTVLSLLVDRWE